MSVLLDEREVKALLVSVGQHLAELPTHQFEALYAALRDAPSPDMFAADLEGEDLGLADAAKEALIMEACFSDEWESMRDRLLRAMILTRTGRA